MDLQPLGDRLIVEVLDEEEVLASGIVLGLGLWVGHSGGALVYEHGAANAYVGVDAKPHARHVAADRD